MWVNVEIKQMYKTGRFRAKPDPGQFLSGKKIVPKYFLYIVDFINEVYGKTDFGQKTGPGRPGNIRDSWDLDKALFLVYIHYQIEKI